MVMQRLLILACTVIAIAGCRSKSPVIVEEPVTPVPAAEVEPKEVINPAPTPSYIWTYGEDRGPNQWGSLTPDFVACAQGKKQSPINLAWRKPTKKAPRMDFSYTPSNVQVDVSTPTPALKVNGGNQLLLNGKVFNLERIEFHSPSEHQLSKNALTMEIQFIHRAVSGNGHAALAVFAIEGRDNSLLNDVWNQLAAGPGNFQFDAAKLIPPQKTFYTYTGSLTAPPCTEGVEWIVFNTPVELSKEQILAFRSKFPPNSRPIQPLNGRKILNH